ncbi:F-box/RNI-like superfamily protein, partial [Striga asiatica]
MVRSKYLAAAGNADTSLEGGRGTSVNRWKWYGVVIYPLTEDTIDRPWRHKGSTRSNLDCTQQDFNSIVDRTLQGYHDQNLSIHKLHLDISNPVISLLDKWIPMITALNIKVFILNFHSLTCHLSFTPEYYESLQELHLRNLKLISVESGKSPDSRPVISLLDKWIPIIVALNIKAFKLIILSYYCLPSAVFLAESLEELHLCNGRLSPVESVRFKSLRTLTLEQVQVDGRTFEKIILGCPFLRRLVLRSCCELRNLRLSEAALSGLKHFELRDSERIEGCSIEIDVPNLETVSIKGK